MAPVTACSLVLKPLFVRPIRRPRWSSGPHLTPPLPTVGERLRGPIRTRGVASPQSFAIDKDHAAQHKSVIDTGLAMALRKERHQPRHLLLGQPEMMLISTPVNSGASITKEHQPQADQWVLTLEDLPKTSFPKNRLSPPSFPPPLITLARKTGENRRNRLLATSRALPRKTLQQTPEA